MINLLFYFAAGIALAAGGRNRTPSPGAAFAAGLTAFIFVGFLDGWIGLGGHLLQALRVVASVLLLLMLVRRPDVLRSFLPLRSARPVGRMANALALGLFVLQGIGLILLVRAAGMPIASYDVLSYHIPLAREFASADAGHGVLHQPSIFYGRLPLGASILEGAFVGSDYHDVFGLGIPAFIACCILAGASCAARVTAWLGGRLVARRLAFVLYLFHPMVFDCMIKALVDPPTALLAIASVEFLLAGLSRRGGWRRFAITGFVLGAAFSTKYSALGVAVIPVGVLAVAFIATGTRQRVVRLLVLGMGFAFAVAPWLLRAQAIGGHPLYPFAGESPGWTTAQGEFVVKVHEPQTPLQAAYWTRAVSSVRLYGIEVPRTGLSLLLLAGFLLAGRRRDRFAFALFLAAFAGFFFWLTVRNNPARFLLPSVALMIPASAVAITRGFGRGNLRHGALVVVIALAIAQSWPTASALVGSGTVYTEKLRDEALDDVLGTSFTQVMRPARNHPRNQRLLLFFEAKGALFGPNAVYQTVWDQPAWAPDLKRAGSAAEFAQALQGRGFTGIFVNEFEWGRLLDFYAADQFPPGTRNMGNIGLTARLPDGMQMRCFAAFPPHRFAGLDERDLTILRDFLLSCRRSALIVSPAGPGAEIWYAPIPNDSTTP